jgi:tRNA pseudouridine-54 N-methylase
MPLHTPGMLAPCRGPCRCQRCIDAFQYDVCPPPAQHSSEPKPAKAIVEAAPQHCHYCGSLAHFVRDCKFGATLERSDQFLLCSPQCFARRFIVPLHRARTDFDLQNLREGRIDLASRLVTAAMVCSQRLRHNAELWLPFLGDATPSTLCVTGGLVRGLHPCEQSTASRIRQAIDERGGGIVESASRAAIARQEGDAAGAAINGASGDASAVDDFKLDDYDVRGFRFIRGGLDEAVVEALTLARADGTPAPLLLLVQGAPPLPTVLGELDIETLRDIVIVLGDDRGIFDDEIERVTALGSTVAGGGPVLKASLGTGCLLASQCVVIANHYLDGLHDCPSQLWTPSMEAKKRSKQRAKKVKKGLGHRKPGRPASVGGWANDSSDSSDGDD